MKLTFTLAIIFLSLNVIAQDLQLGLEGHYQFNGNLEDLSDNSITGVGMNLTATLGLENITDTGYAFNGENSVVNLSTENRNIEKELSISVWIKTEDDKRQFILSKYLSTEGRGYFLGVDDGKVVFGGRNGASDSGSNFIQVTGNIAVNDGTWHHITAISSEYKWIIYTDCIIDNVLETTNANFDLSTTIDMTIGNWIEGTGYGEFRFFNGLIDEVRIYSRSLNEDEIDNVCNQGILNSSDDITSNIEEFFLFPNPTINNLNISTEIPYISECIYKIYSVDGKIISEGNLIAPITVDGINSGFYYLSIFFEGKFIVGSKFVKNE